MGGSLRVVIDGPRDPRLNMAIDEAIARSRSRREYDTLRIYMWLPSGVSIGRRQRVEDTVYLDRVRERGYVLVRRPTGGAALLHPQDWEVTYSVVLSREHPLYSLDVSSSAARIAEIVSRTIRRLGVESGVRGAGSPWTSSFCYVNPGSSDVIVMGRKVSGSAQRRDWGSLLQHGTLLLRYDPSEFVYVIKMSEEEREEAYKKIAGLSDFIEDLDLEKIIAYMIESAREVLGHERVFIGGLEPDEIRLAHELYTRKYSSDTWNIGGEDPYR